MDNRPDVLKWHDPIELELVRVPAGSFLMGSHPRTDPLANELANEDEFPQCLVSLPEFYIGKYHITNHQWAMYLLDTVGKDVNETNSHWETYRLAAKGDFSVATGKAVHPVVYVTWFAAVRFCHWLSEKSGARVMLPSEAEWERAARGTHGHIYPWGNQLPQHDLSNYGRRIGTTTPVGFYSPYGDSPCGCADMAGNASDWTRTLWDSDDGERYRYPYNPDDGRETMHLERDTFCREMVFRGGDYGSGPIKPKGVWGLRCAARNHWPADQTDDFVSFRIVVHAK